MRHFFRHRLVLGCSALLALVTGSPSALQAATPDQIEFFESRIRPILAQECYECHQTEGKVKGGLILDHRAGLLAGGDSGASIVPGDPDDSLLLQVIRHEHEEMKMPKAGAKLDEQALRDFEQWIADGAADPRDTPPSAEQLAADTDWEAIRERRATWWSFQRVTEPTVPAEASDSDHPVDDFVAAGLEGSGLSPAEPASAAVLVRRLYLTLIGIPPTPEEVAAFEKAHAENPGMAIEGKVDDLLSRPQFGERWARHWMDWVRYAETHGSEGDPAIPFAHHYRDYLIRALNEDVPYDQLVREHVAGDLLSEPRMNAELGINESAIGPAHWRMVFHGFAPTDALDEKVRFTDDQINVFSKAFLGLTISCARCHDHKFDAISQADYYALFGILNSTRPATIDAVPAENRTQALETLTSLKEEIRSDLASQWLDNVAGLNQIMEGLPARPENLTPDNLLWPWYESQSKEPRVVWKQLSNAVNTYEAAWAEFRTREDVRIWEADEFANWFLEDATEVLEAGSFSLHPEGEEAVRGVYPTGIYSHTLTDRLRAVAASPRFDLGEDQHLQFQTIGDNAAQVRYAVQNYPRKGTVYPVRDLKDGQWQWQGYNMTYWSGDSIHIEMNTAADAPVLANPGQKRSWFGLRRVVIQDQAAKVAPRTEFGPLSLLLDNDKEGLGMAERYQLALRNAITRWESGHATDDEALLLDQAIEAGLLENFLSKSSVAVQQKIARYRAIESALIQEPYRVPGLAEADIADQPLYVRGDHKQPADPVPRRFLEAIDEEPYADTDSGRLELAEDLLRTDNPFTSRVIANRIWHYLFGAGLVDTPDNFGRMGSKPSHPELLDWLALEMQEQDWSMKEMIRLIVLSDTWQQSSALMELAQKSDPENRLLSHQSVRRLDAEVIRDSLLAVSGKLEEDIYGPPAGANTPRRSVYRAIRRNSLDPFLEVFDAPVPFATKGSRDATNVPAQSLTLLNDPFVIQSAQELANRVADLPDEERVKSMFQIALGREPASQELQQSMYLLDGLASQHAESAAQITGLQEELKNDQATRKAILQEARQALQPEANQQAATPPEVPSPMAAWDFENGLLDQIGNLHGEVGGNARVQDGMLILDGNSWVSTAPIPKKITARTLEAVVMLDDANQRGGGVMTIQNLDGVGFDSIVYAEKQPFRWLAGSNRHLRTLSFDAWDETEATTLPVHLCVVWEADGHIRAWRNGVPYGERIRKAAALTYAANNAQILFGLRHGRSGSGNRLLSGSILEARFYDRALTAEEIRDAAKASGTEVPITRDRLLAELSESELQKLQSLETRIAELQTELEAVPLPDPDQPWADLALALFNTKEFIYLR